MGYVYSNRKRENDAIRRNIVRTEAAMNSAIKMTEERDFWERIAQRAIYELNKTDPGWQVMTHEQILERLCELENLETPKA